MQISCFTQGLLYLEQGDKVAFVCFILFIHFNCIYLSIQGQPQGQQPGKQGRLQSWTNILWHRQTHWRLDLNLIFSNIFSKNSVSNEAHTFICGVTMTRGLTTTLTYLHSDFFMLTIIHCPNRVRRVKVNKVIGDAGSTADLRMLWSAIVCLGLL